MSEFGRGAWNSKGVGGTLKLSGGKTVPGPYYMLAQNDAEQIGLKTWCLREQGLPVRLEYNAVFHAVVGLQMLCKDYYADVKPDGIFGPETDLAVRRAQEFLFLTTDGQVGPKTMKALMKPVLQRRTGILGFAWEPVYGILQYEGGWDPGAVGYHDQGDWGLAQINSKSHPHISFAEAFCPSFAISFVINYISSALNALDGDLRTAVASYNLGIGGARQWVAAGRPDVWTPPHAVSFGERKVKEYIDRILDAHKS